MAYWDDPTETYAARTHLVTALLAVVVLAFFPLLTLGFGAASTLTHEIGHSLLGWLFGYPSIPAFDFTYGGGVAITFDRNVQLFWLWGLNWLAALLIWRRNRVTRILLLMLPLPYILAVRSELDQSLILLWGHAGELGAALFSLYRSGTGRGLATPAERPVWAFLGFFLIFHQVQFMFQLQSGGEMLEWYLEGKGDLPNDLVRLGWEWGLSVKAWARLYLMASLATLPLAGGLVLFRESWLPAVGRLLERE